MVTKKELEHSIDILRGAADSTEKLTPFHVFRGVLFKLLGLSHFVESPLAGIGSRLTLKP
jgi:hypothetical protein